MPRQASVARNLGAKRPKAVSTGTRRPKAAPRPRKRSELELIAENRLERAGLAGYVTELVFDSTGERDWRFDFAWPRSDARTRGVAVEVEGGTWSGGRHVRGKGFEDDALKYSVAAIQGWVVIRCTRRQVEDGTLVRLVRAALERTTPAEAEALVFGRVDA